jgi:TolA-binding protein
MRFTIMSLMLLFGAVTAFSEIASPPPVGNSSPVMEDALMSPEKRSLDPSPGQRPNLVPSSELDTMVADVEESPNYHAQNKSDSRQISGLEAEIQRAIEGGDPSLAEELFNKLLQEGASDVKKRDAILLMGRGLQDKLKETSKAIVVYEQFLDLFPNDPEAPDVMLRLGRIYRDQGAFSTALNKFYGVLYSSLQVKIGGKYEDASLRAKMEIAHTHFAAGEYQKALELYSRIKLLDMSQEEASEVAFRRAYISYLAKDYAVSLNDAQVFLANYPASPLAPEAQYVYVQSLKSLGREQEAMRETMKLLEAGRQYGKKNPAIWIYWQRKTGNDIANELYENNDIVGALSIYQKLANLDTDPGWRGSAVYQIGLCFERLRHINRAKEAYKWIVDKVKPVKPGPTDALLGINLETLHELASWRLDNLAWMEKTEQEVYPLLNKPIPPPKHPTAENLPAPTELSQAAQVIGGNPIPQGDAGLPATTR